MLSHLSIGALAVAGAAAFMIPPNVALESTSKSAIPNMVTDPFSIKLFVPCKSCPYAEFNDKGIVWKEGTDNALFLNVAVNNKLDTVELNGVQIYPPPMPSSFRINPEVPAVAQIPSTVPLRDVERNREKYLAHPLKLTSFGIEATTVHSLKETGEEIIKIRLSVNGLEGKTVNVPDVIITALKNPEVHLMVLNVELREPQEVSKGCHGMPLLCKFKGIIADMSNSFRGKVRGKCHKARPHQLSAAEQHKEEELEKPKHGSHHKEHHKGDHKVHHKGDHHHHGHHHHRLHRFLHKVANVLLTIVIPLLLGILAGMLTYTVGMLFGTFIALVWIRVRGMRRNYQPIALDDEEVPRESFDKSEFVEELYVEAPPIYVEVEAKEVSRQE